MKIGYQKTKFASAHNTDTFSPRMNSGKSYSKYFSSTSAKQKTRRKKGTEKLLERNMQQLEASFDLMNKYTTPEIIEKLSESPNTEKILRLSIKASSKKKSRENSSTPQKNFLKNPEKIEKLQEVFEKVISVKSYGSPYNTSLNGSINNPISIYQFVTEQYDDGTRYEGEKLIGKRHGKGVYYYKEGYRYEGGWTEDQMSGFGVLWLDGDYKWYEGDWKDNNFHGNGVLCNNASKIPPKSFDGTDFMQLGSAWIRYEGGFLKGKKNGFGKLLISNGDIFVGHFVNDTVHGSGSYTQSGLNTNAGKWNCNILMSYF